MLRQEEKDLISIQIEKDIEGTPMAFIKDYEVVSILYLYKNRFMALLKSDISDVKIVVEKNMDGSMSYSLRR